MSLTNLSAGLIVSLLLAGAVTGVAGFVLESVAERSAPRWEPPPRSTAALEKRSAAEGALFVAGRLRPLGL